MGPEGRSGAMRVVRSPGFVGGCCAVLAAVVLYSRFSLRLWVNRDAFLYLYGGQRVLHGQPPYVSEMDPKGPVSSLLSAGGIAIARLLGVEDILAVRVVFLALAVLGVLGVYLLVRALFDSVLAAVFAAVAFTAFRSFAFNAVAGPEGHLPGIVFLVFAPVADRAPPVVPRRHRRGAGGPDLAAVVRLPDGGARVCRRVVAGPAVARRGGRPWPASPRRRCC